MPCKATILTHPRNAGESMGSRRGNRAEQSQFAEELADCNGLSIKQLQHKDADCPRAKTKPILVVEIASSALGLLAMTGAALANSPRGTRGQTCRTKPISGGADGASCIWW
jgi:hypothetical protein